jgi:osmotically-inducible protein OsmY
MGAGALTRNDDRIRDAVIVRLEWERNADATAIGVTVDDGVVTLTGHVPSWMDREEAGCAAWGAPGVRTVENRITVTV